jgi:pimeloyl-ACP methyl ester carboxylesterase
MPELKHGDVSIYYEVHGNGFPLLLIAPGGMRSTVEFWGRMPFNPIAEFASDFQVVAMDQRNAGRSTGPVGEGWASYTDDQEALLGHLGIDHFHVMGGCIGCSYALGLMHRAGNRVAAAVLQNPIGLDNNHQVFVGMIQEWANELKPKRPQADAAALDALPGAMLGGDFVFTVSRDFVKSCPTPLLVLPGNDDFHPTSTAREIAALSPAAEYIEDWRLPENVPNTVQRIRAFLKQHTP